MKANSSSRYLIDSDPGLALSVLAPIFVTNCYFTQVFYRDFEERYVQVTSSSTQEKKSVAFIAEEDAFFSFCFQDRPRTGWIISEDRFVTFTWKIAHEEVDSITAKWDVDRELLAPLERTLEAIDLEAQEMVAEINHRKQIHGELRSTMGTIIQNLTKARILFSPSVTLTATLFFPRAR